VAVFRFAKAVLRVTPELLSAGVLPAALAATLPHISADTPQALVCAGGVCQPPTADPAELQKLLASAVR